VRGGRFPSLHASKLFLWQSSFGLLSSVHHLEFRNPGAYHFLLCVFRVNNFRFFRFITATVAATEPPGSQCSAVEKMLLFQKNVLSSFIGFSFIKSQFLSILLIICALFMVTVILFCVRLSQRRGL
jgi:hypothetical protein